MIGIPSRDPDAHTMVVALGSSLKNIARETIRRTLAEVTNHREKAAKLLGINLFALQYKIREYAIREQPSGCPS